MCMTIMEVVGLPTKCLRILYRGCRGPVKTAGKSLRAWWHRHQRLRRRWTACRWSHAFEAAEPLVLRRTAETWHPTPAFRVDAFVT